MFFSSQLTLEQIVPLVLAVHSNQFWQPIFQPKAHLHFVKLCFQLLWEDLEQEHLKSKLAIVVEVSYFKVIFYLFF